MPEALQEAAAKWQRKPVSIHLAPGEMSISQTITQVHPCLLLLERLAVLIILPCAEGIALTLQSNAAELTHILRCYCAQQFMTHSASSVAMRTASLLLYGSLVV